MTTTLPSSAYNELVAAIVKAVPELSLVECLGCKQRRQKKHLLMKDARPITLEDVLMALQEHIKEPIEPKWNAIPTDEEAMKMIQWKRDNPRYSLDEHYYGEGRSNRITRAQAIGFKVVILWTLGKPLSEQSPETISLLHSLLCK